MQLCRNFWDIWVWITSGEKFACPLRPSYSRQDKSETDKKISCLFQAYGAECKRLPKTERNVTRQIDLQNFLFRSVKLWNSWFFCSLNYFIKFKCKQTLSVHMQTAVCFYLSTVIAFFSSLFWYLFLAPFRLVLSRVTRPLLRKLYQVALMQHSQIKFGKNLKLEIFKIKVIRKCVGPGFLLFGKVLSELKAWNQYF